MTRDVQDQAGNLDNPTITNTAEHNLTTFRENKRSRHQSRVYATPQHCATLQRMKIDALSGGKRIVSNNHISPHQKTPFTKISDMEGYLAATVPLVPQP